MFPRRRSQRDFSEEIEAHVQLETDRLQAEGMPREDAVLAAQRSFGNATAVRERYFERGRTMWLLDLVQDVKYAARTLRRNPAFTAVAVLTLALGMGVNTAVISLVNTLALRALPVPEPESIVHAGILPSGGRTLFSYPDYLDFRDRNRTFTGLVAFNKTTAVLGDAPLGPPDGDSPLTNRHRQYAFGLIVTANYFDVLGARFQLGRAFSAEEDRLPGQHPVIVVSHSFWERHLAKDGAIVGKTVRLSGQPLTVVGVMARDFVGTAPEIPDYWAPVTMRDALATGWYAGDWFSRRDARCLALLGRLRPGVTREQAQSDLRVIEQQLLAQRPVAERGAPPLRITSGSTFYSLDDYAPFVVPLFGAVGLVLLVACANVANLLLSRATARQREIAIRLAIGSSRGRLLRQLLTESVLLATIGSIAALALSEAAIRIMTPVLLKSLPLPDGLAETVAFDPSLDWRTFALTAGLAVVTGVLFGLFPAVESSRADVSESLKGLGAAGRKGVVRDSLVAGQIAVCAVLLICAGLITRNVRNLERPDLGLRTSGAVAIATGLPGQSSLARTAQLRTELGSRLAARPGVDAVGEARRSPLSGGMPSLPVSLPGSEQSNDAPRAQYNLVTPGYFRVFELRAIRGRTLSEEDSRINAAVVVISEATAKRFWPNQDAIGQRITLGNGDRRGLYQPQREVVGVVPDVRSGNVWRRDETMIYAPLVEGRDPQAYLLVRLPGAVNPAEQIGREARELNPNLNVSVHAIDSTVDYQLAPFRALAALAAVLGALALVMALIGVYGVISFWVTQRTKEFGIRLALGATRGNLLGLVLRAGMRLAAAGLSIGVLMGIGAVRLIAVVLTDVSRFDPSSFLGVALVLLLVATVACAIPARRAARVDPLVSLRCD